jgi:hypothetical protein
MDKPARKSRGEELDFGLVAANQRLTPEERVNAFLTHSQLMVELYQAGRAAGPSLTANRRWPSKTSSR